MRSGFTYTATAIGINGFDPVLAVLDTETGEGLCSDDDSGAANYAANLPTTGASRPPNLSAQIDFQPERQQHPFARYFAGGRRLRQSGRRIPADPRRHGRHCRQTAPATSFDVNVTPGMVASGVPLTVYMIASTTISIRTSVQTDASLNLTRGQQGRCSRLRRRRATRSLCWGNSTDLSKSSVTHRRGQSAGRALRRDAQPRPDGNCSSTATPRRITPPSS